MDYPHLWSRLYGQPLAVHPEKAAIIEAIFRSRVLNVPLPAEVEAAAARVVQRPPLESAAQVKFREQSSGPYALTEAGVAVIPVLGTLVQRTSGLDALSGMMSYGSIGRRLTAAAEDPAVRAVLLEVDSYGGEAYGLAELATLIAAIDAEKPVWAAINEQAFSAAYFIASAASRVTIPVSGLTGSIGVIALHVDQSKRDATQGYKYTYLYAGARKKDFNPHEPLTEPARDAVQAEVDRHYGLFVAHVAARRGIAEETVRATEAGLLAPELARAGGFVNEIASFPETIGMIEDALRPDWSRSTGARMAASRDSSTAKEHDMSDKKEVPAASASAPAEQPKHTDAQLAAARTEERTAARARVFAILNCEEAKGRGKLAAHLAEKTEMSAEEAKAMLAAAAVEAEAKPAPKTPLAAAMDNVPNPNVGADADEEARILASKPRIDSAAIYAMWNKPQGDAKTH